MSSKLKCVHLTLAHVCADYYDILPIEPALTIVNARNGETVKMTDEHRWLAGPEDYLRIRFTGYADLLRIEFAEDTNLAKFHLVISSEFLSEDIIVSISLYRWYLFI